MILHHDDNGSFLLYTFGDGELHILNITNPELIQDYTTLSEFKEISQLKDITVDEKEYFLIFDTVLGMVIADFTDEKKLVKIINTDNL